jgi:hypothetical protein
VNGTAIQTFGAKWSEKDLCGVRPRLVGARLLKFLEGFVFVSGMNALNVKLEHADLFNHKGSAQSTVLQVALLAKQAFSRTFFVAKIGFRLA